VSAASRGRWRLLARGAPWVAALLTLAAAPPAAQAWGNEGHQAVAAIAGTLIAGTNAARHVQALLRDGETLADASVWADCAKGYCGPPTPEMDAFVAANPGHAGYHYTDVPIGVHEYVRGAVGTHPDDIVQTLIRAIDVLRGRAGPDANPHGWTERQALLLLVHMTGDIHQPLHVGSPYVGDGDAFAAPKSRADLVDGRVRPTLGGNDLVIGSRVLHTYWDVDLVRRAMLRSGAATPGDYAAWLLAKHPAAARDDEGDAATWPIQWANDTLRLAEEVQRGLGVAGRSELRDRTGAPRLRWRLSVPDDYAERSTDAVELQLAKAGKRLAAVLAAIWP